MIIKKYLSNLKLSTSSIDYYVEMLKKPLRSSFYFFIASMFIIGAIRGINLALTDLPSLKNETEIALDELSENFDENLEITWADNQLEMNKENLSIYWPSRFDHQYYNLPSTLALINNSEKPPAESKLLDNNTSAIYINKNNFYTFSELEEQKWTEYPLDTVLGEISSYSINKQNLPKTISQIKEGINKSFGKVQSMVGVFSTLVFVVSKIWFLLTQSILVYLLFKIYSLNFSFKKVLKLNLNILVPTEIIGTTSNILYKDLNFPMETIAFWVILTFISFHLTKNKKIK